MLSKTMSCSWSCCSEGSWAMMSRTSTSTQLRLAGHPGLLGVPGSRPFHPAVLGRPVGDQFTALAQGNGDRSTGAGCRWLVEVVVEGVVRLGRLVWLALPGLDFR
jgi:hypothetical protein